MTLHVDKSGLEVFGVKPYEIEILRIAWRDGRVCSRDVYNELQEGENAMSRPSVINSLNRMARLGFFTVEAEAKGGKVKARRWYSPSDGAKDEETFVAVLISNETRRILDMFKEEK